MNARIIAGALLAVLASVAFEGPVLPRITTAGFLLAGVAAIQWRARTVGFAFLYAAVLAAALGLPVAMTPRLLVGSVLLVAAAWCLLSELLDARPLSRSSRGILAAIALGFALLLAVALNVPFLGILGGPRAAPGVAVAIVALGAGLIALVLRPRKRNWEVRNARRNED